MNVCNIEHFANVQERGRG